ncbi:MAG: ROK family protein [Pseudomonadota bacterium]
MPLVGAIEGGGTKFVCAVGTSPAQILDRVLIPTSDATTTLAACLQFFARMSQEHGPIAAVGVACFGPLQLDTDSPDYGCMQATPKPGWSNAPIVAPLREALEVPILLDTDVGAAATGEWRLGAGRGAGSLAYVTVGTGIGGAVVPAMDARQRLMHAEMGHLRVRRDPRDSDFPGICPFHGDCLEGVACGPAIHARWGCDLSSLPQEHPGRSIIAGYLGQLASSIALLHAVRRIVFGGGVMAEDSLLQRIRLATHEQLNGYLQPLRSLQQVTECLSPPLLGEHSAVAGGLLRALDSLAT